MVIIPLLLYHVLVAVFQHPHSFSAVTLFALVVIISYGSIMLTNVRMGEIVCSFGYVIEANRGDYILQNAGYVFFRRLFAKVHDG
jgi:hypothetical protein